MTAADISGDGNRRKINLIDVTLRDAHQCLWATRMTTAMMRETAPLLDRAGFEAIDLVGGAVFDVCVRYLHEDPWERMRILSGWITETPLILHHRGQSLFTFELFADDVVELTAERMIANGMRYHTTYDALNDIRNLEIPILSAKRLGMHTVGGLVYTESPVHTDEYYVGKARELLMLGVDGVFIKDPSGLLRPERVPTLVPALKEVCRDVPLQLHSHCLTGLSPYVAVLAVEHGVDTVPHGDVDPRKCRIASAHRTVRQERAQTRVRGGYRSGDDRTGCRQAALHRGQGGQAGRWTAGVRRVPLSPSSAGRDDFEPGSPSSSRWASSTSWTK